jgi:c-di-GMP-binding flagellar brake protein YcgR
VWGQVLKKESTMAEEENRVYPRAKLKWIVLFKVDGKVTEGVTKDISVSGAYVCCAKPLRLNEVVDMVIKAPDKSLSVRAEVVWSNIYGPDDDINPRGMGVRFLEISGEDRRFIAKAVMKHLEESKEEIDPKHLQTLQTLVIEPEQAEAVTK